MASSTKIISTPSITINNQIVPIVPNSFSYTEGFGEQNVKTQSLGGGSIQTVYVDNAETKFSTIKFTMFPTNDNVTALLSWKRNGNANAISAAGQQDGGVYMTRSFQYAAFTSDYEVKMGADQVIEVEFKSAAAV
jgi:hypothetical protein